MKPKKVMIAMMGGEIIFHDNVETFEYERGVLVLQCNENGKFIKYYYPLVNGRVLNWKMEDYV